jgi:hypothetical protein
LFRSQKCYFVTSQLFFSKDTSLEKKPFEVVEKNATANSICQLKRFVGGYYLNYSLIRNASLQSSLFH